MTYPILENKVAIITGAASGIGRATAILFAEAKAKVVVADILEAEGKQVVDEINQKGGEAIFVKTDIADTKQVQNMVNETVKRFGRLDVAVNNAAEAPDSKSVVDFDEEYWDRLAAVDLKGTALCMKYELRQMLAQNQGGSIINISSCITARVQAASVGYISSKYGVIGMTEGAAIEVGDKNIRVNCIRPGAIESAMLLGYFESVGADVAAYASVNTELCRLGKPEEIADGCLWLASDMSSYVTGAIIDIDGGYQHR